MQRSEIRGRRTVHRPFPDFASLHPGYDAISIVPARGIAGVSGQCLKSLLRKRLNS
jgi:hypothetical protein